MKHTDKTSKSSRTVKPPNIDQVSGVLILTAVAFALFAANSSLAGWYTVLHHTPIRVGVAPYQLDEPLIVWINQGLMTLFFLLVGLEIKQELVAGHLSTLRTAALPAIAAIGGMAVPAAIFVALNLTNGEALRGWAVPTATDIALALAALSLLGNRVPTALKAFVMALAIFDDIGAVIIIAAFYGEEIQSAPLMGAVLTYVVLVALNRFNVARPVPLVILGAILWLALLRSGIEAALAGVLIASVVPHEAKKHHGQTLLRRTERALHPWASLLIVPLFGFFNAGVAIETSTLGNLDIGVATGVILGLFIGKQAGIFGATWCAVRLGVGVLPNEVKFVHIYGAALLAGIGFTMALFITQLAFETPHLAATARIAILLGSSLSGMAGLWVLWKAGRVAVSDFR